MVESFSSAPPFGDEISDKIYHIFHLPMQDSKKKMWWPYAIFFAILVGATAASYVSGVVYRGGGGGTGGGASGGDVGGGVGSGPSGWSFSDMLRYGRPDPNKFKPLPPPKKPKVDVKKIKLKFRPGEPRLEHIIVAYVWSRGFCLAEERCRIHIATVLVCRVHGVWPSDQRASLDIKFDDSKVLQNIALLNEDKFKWKT